MQRISISPMSEKEGTLSNMTDSAPSTDRQSQPDSRVPLSLVLRALSGLATATKSTNDQMQPAIDAIQSIVDNAENPADNEPARSLRDWHAHAVATTSNSGTRHRANVALALAFLCHSGRQQLSVRADDLDFTWHLVREALLSSSLTFTVQRSAQGFLAIPLWSLIKNGNIEELFRLHVWLPDNQRGVTSLSIHAHQSFAESWILAGQGKNHSYDVQPADKHDATHAEYCPTWSNSSGTATGTTYQTHQKFSTVTNTGKLVRVKHEEGEVHTRGMSYTVPAGTCHASDVAPDFLHATMFVFDSSRGFQKAAPVLGPIDEESYTQHRDPAGMTPVALVGMVESVRAWETIYQQGLHHARRAQWDEAAHAYRGALHICSSPSFPDNASYRQAVLSQLSHVDKMLGRCEPVLKVGSSTAPTPTTTVV